MSMISIYISYDVISMLNYILIREYWIKRIEISKYGLKFNFYG